ncbi:MAG: IPT/TIG domain-containing protein [Prevotella sp.]|nr:IPT/TIG domain-containing protein [Prevotella sp.]
MKHIINYLGALLAVVLIGTTFTACSDDDAQTANVGLGIKTFFPTKVVTNQPMTINGSGFNSAKEIEFPGGTKVTNFEIVSDNMIRVNAPSGIPATGGKIVVRTDNDEAESRLSLTLGHTNVSGYSKQPGEKATGGELITVYGTDLEFINSVELLDADGETQLIDHKDFYRKGTSNLVFRVPQKNIFKGTFAGILHTYDGQSITMPELAYEPGADDGHWETVKTPIWTNGGTLGEINWSSDYRFASEESKTGEECYAVPMDIWSKMKAETFFITIKGDNPQVRITTGWWSTNLTADDIMPGNELLTDNGDGTWTVEITLGNSADLLGLVDEQHLLFTGSGYTVEEIYFAEEVWVPGGGGEQEVKVPVWTNGGTLGEINWSGDYRFASEESKTGEECYAIPMDVWNKMKAETFYVTVKGDSPQIRVTTGWWSTNLTADDIMSGNELLEDNGDGTWKLTVNLGSSADLLGLVDEQHLLFTGSGYTVEEIYFIEMVSGGGGADEVVIWQGDGSAGAVSWNGTYRFSNAESTTGEEIYAIPMDQWEIIRTKTFYLDLEGEDPQIRVTTGWWSTNLTADDIQPGNELLKDNGNGTWTLEVNLSGATDLLDLLDEQHLLFTGDRYTPLKLYYYK